MTGRGRPRNKSKTGTSVTTAMANEEADEGCGDAQELSTVSNPVINNNSGTLLSGNAPSFGPPSSAYIQRPKFNGKDWSVFEVIFETHLRQLQLQAVLSQESPDSESNTRVYDELILCLDHESIKAICNTAQNDGKQAWVILKEKYLGDKSQRKTNAINAITNIQINPNDCIEAKLADIEGHKKILDQHKLCDDTVLVGLFTRALPPAYNTFKVITSHGGYPPWSRFKTLLRNFISNSFNSEQTSKSTVLSINANQPTYIQKHKNRRADYFNKKIKHCAICNKRSHNTTECWHNQYNNNNSETTRPHPNARGRGRGLQSNRGFRGGAKARVLVYPGTERVRANSGTIFYGNVYL